MDLNKVILIGNLARDPVVRALPSGGSVTVFDLATTHQWRDIQTKQMKEMSQFHDIVAWRKLGEVAARYLKKGSRVYVEGRLQNRSWEGKDGKKEHQTQVVISNLIMLGGGQRANQALAEEGIDVTTVPAS